MTICPKCSSTSLSIAQGGMRCQQCGHQERGVSSHQANQTYYSYPAHPSGVRSRLVTECEDIEALHAAWTTNRSELVHEEPLVSIIMPTFRRQHTIYTTIGSILNQTFTAWELIVIDNQPDSNYQFDDSRIRYYKHSEERGAAYGRNMGLQYVKSEHVGFFDDDDIMLPNYLQCMMAPFLQNKNVNMTQCRVKLVEGRVTPHNTFCTPSAIIKTKLAKPDWQKSSAHDIWFFKAIVDRIPADSVINIPDILVNAYTSPRGGIREGAL